MCYGISETLTKGFLLWFICHCFSNAGTGVYSTPLNNSQEIKNIFNNAQVLQNATHNQSDLNGTSRSKSFAEGGVIDVHVLSPTVDLNKKHEQDFHNAKNDSAVKRQNITSSQGSTTKSKSHNLLESSTYKTLQHKNLTEPGSDLFLGVPEVIHINGISSIKPRKGVDNDSKESFSLLSNFSCFWLARNDCYNAEEVKDLKCTCCSKTNTQGEIFKQQALVDCSKCKPMLLATEEKRVCQNICCEQIFHDINAISTTQDDIEKPKNNSKPKPTVTKVPYDVEVVTQLLSKSKRKVFLPVVVSLLLLPVIGIFIFFIWKKTKEYWDKRFYKRMDFLIDGMYNS